MHQMHMLFTFERLTLNQVSANSLMLLSNQGCLMFLENPNITRFFEAQFRRPSKLHVNTDK